VRLALLALAGAGIIAFVATGFYMVMHFPAAYAGGEEIRYLYRANHIYLLLASLLSMTLGLYWSGARPGWRGKVALFGAWLLLAAPVVLAGAFLLEPPHGSPERPITFFGVLFALAGALLQWPNRISRG
jgi:hypothetical protein